MYKYDMYEVGKAISAYQPGQRGYSVYRRRHNTWRSQSRQWDYIVGFVCTGCGRPLGRYEKINKLAFCFDCRRILFPETVNMRREQRFRAPYTKPRGHYW